MVSRVGKNLTCFSLLSADLVEATRRIRDMEEEMNKKIMSNEGLTVEVETNQVGIFRYLQ